MKNADANSEEKWVPARLLSTAGIRNQMEQERRGASALLAVMSAVPDFTQALLAGMGAPRGTISTFTELRFKDVEDRTHIPDGAVVIQRGKKRWSCLVEIKTSGVPLASDQMTRYLDLAREHGFDGVLTVSNQIASDPTVLPYAVPKPKLRNLAVHHLSWWRVLTEAIVQHRFRGIADPDQAWLLGELIRYLDDEKSGATGFEGMGGEWVKVRESARNGTLRESDPEAEKIAKRWEEFAEYLCLHLSQELGVDVKHLRGRTPDPVERIADATKRLAADGTLECAMRVPEAVGPIRLEANLRTRLVTTSVEVEAPREGRPKTRINWLLRQLADAPDELRLDVRYSRLRSTCSELLRDCRGAPERLLLSEDPKREPRTFVLALSRGMGKKGGLKEGSFVAETRRQTTEFYRDLVQGLVSPPTRAPKIREDDKPEAAASVPDPSSGERQARREHAAGLDWLAELDSVRL